MAGEEVEDFGGGEGEPNETVDKDENAESAPDDEARAKEWRRSCVGSGEGRTLACPAFPEAAEAARDFFGREQNHQADAENRGADEILNKGILHGAGI